MAGHVYTENFTIAGGDPTKSEDRPNTTHRFYTLHADFWNTWQQGHLLKLEQDCIGVPPGPGGECTGGGAVPNNHYDDLLQ